ncbi:MAG: hypothetical protein MJK14_17810 [Rivularia sp. ALOHA_DT_140]|nr:hypothetical protein [Rivularia sp. ALOHA_DT_140]
MNIVDLNQLETVAGNEVVGGGYSKYGKKGGYYGGYYYKKGNSSKANAKGFAEAFGDGDTKATVDTFAVAGDGFSVAASESKAKFDGSKKYYYKGGKY